MRKAADIILECLERKKMSQRCLAREMGEDVRNLNQQLKRLDDMKVSRFFQVLGYIGYRVEVVENGGIRRISYKKAMDIVETRKPEGRFWFLTESDGQYNGLDNSRGEAWVESFTTEEECLKWLQNEPAVDANGYLHEV